jgi:hypothetical protein
LFSAKPIIGARHRTVNMDKIDKEKKRRREYNKAYRNKLEDKLSRHGKPGKKLIDKYGKDYLLKVHKDFISQDKSMEDIAKHLGTSKWTAQMMYSKTLGIKTPNKTCKGKKAWNNGLSKETSATVAKMAADQKVTQKNLWKDSVKRAAWSKRMKSVVARKENHWNWQGGKSFEQYPEEWTKELRLSIFARDNYTCSHCNIRGGSLVVHHEDENKHNCFPTNLTTLHRSCHGRHHALRSGLGTITG